MSSYPDDTRAFACVRTVLTGFVKEDLSLLDLTASLYLDTNSG
jgi:hypothetical protein